MSSMQNAAKKTGLVTVQSILFVALKQGFYTGKLSQGQLRPSCFSRVVRRATIKTYYVVTNVSDNTRTGS